MYSLFSFNLKFCVTSIFLPAGRVISVFKLFRFLVKNEAFLEKTELILFVFQRSVNFKIITFIYFKVHYSYYIFHSFIKIRNNIYQIKSVYIHRTIQ